MFGYKLWIFEKAHTLKVGVEVLSAACNKIQLWTPILLESRLNLTLILLDLKMVSKQSNQYWWINNCYLGLFTYSLIAIVVLPSLFTVKCIWYVNEIPLLHNLISTWNIISLCKIEKLKVNLYHTVWQPWIAILEIRLIKICL